MPYTLTFNFDGNERSEPIDAATSRASAIAIAKDAFERSYSKEKPRPEYATCSVFDDEEPLGLWDLDPERRPRVKWEEARD